MTLSELANVVSRCNRCELSRYGSKPVPGVGTASAKLFLVGESPNLEAELKGQPFVGWTGRIISRWLDYIHLPRTEVYMTNAVKCVLRNKSGKIIRDGYGPPGQCLRACRGWLDQELDIVRSKIVVTVGATAINSLFNSSVGKFQQQGYCQKINDRFYCALYHPARHAVELRDDDRIVLDRIRSLLDDLKEGDKGGGFAL